MRRDESSIIKESLRVLQDNGLSFQVGPLSTRLSGSSEAVWNGLKALFERAQAHGTEVAMVVTVANSEA